MVVNFRFAGVTGLMNELHVLVVVSRKNMQLIEAVGGYQTPLVLNDPKNKSAIADCAKTAKEVAELAEKLLSDLKCSHIDSAVRQLRKWGEQENSEWSELNTRVRALRDAAQTELKEYFYYQYPRQKGEKFRTWKSDWQKAVAAFPDIERDVYDATDLYALEHNTASVFHSMRIAERGLRTLAKERRITLSKNKPLEWGTWQDIIRALDDEIKIIGGKRAGGTKDAALAFYSGARADLNGFKDEFRNLVMHVRGTYDEHQALRALTNVHAFMERLAAKIDYSHKRIRWGKF